MNALARILPCLVLPAVLAAQAPGRHRHTVTDAEVKRVHASAILIDTHNDVTSATVAELDIGKPKVIYLETIRRISSFDQSWL